ncbi:hypothetical protein MJO28_009847 [Puccinia striiformis f. sp. tritici]|uniref:Uncharacterized protein n=1 Tax=Puccinia striiformis f. sp. tritici TaxID=168172 RepID=A0ACC0E8E4_9BASI|nr:hypothetical protein Pst134EA_017321 [Puccinia striiformis f. sp. tritici]KAH9461010.1 hypothetical protein Pst134EA_017321 [Puccinia striiformis f. sp. tritici]KAI7947939.1 hypothetical protein MJO28_009847 [Puccinia striiformis f. sp. tritici]KAI9607485.1 hypothetical protein H4Q26_006008 [Puccinia striiformis f. sp. tritici PST-130]
MATPQAVMDKARRKLARYLMEVVQAETSRGRRRRSGPRGQPQRDARRDIPNRRLLWIDPETKPITLRDIEFRKVLQFLEVRHPRALTVKGLPGPPPACRLGTPHRLHPKTQGYLGTRGATARRPRNNDFESINTQAALDSRYESSGLDDQSDSDDGFEIWPMDLD